MTSFALITTTINVPTLLDKYARDARDHDRQVSIYVAGDRKTPAEAAALCERVAADTGIQCRYLDCDAQDEFLAPWPELLAELPWNCVQRRNVAILNAYADGADVVVTIDDDNLLHDPDYFGVHQVVGDQPAKLPAYGQPGQWFNVCRFLQTANGYRFVARGYGMAARAALDDDAPAVATPLALPVAVNAGLWLGDPDIDAVTRLAHPLDVTGYSHAGSFLVAPGALTPFNSQNTALARRALPAYYLSPYVGRFDDIFASFIVKRIADHLGDGIAFGGPLVMQQRNEHDLFHDLHLEMLGMRVVDRFTQALAGLKLTGDSYAACAIEVCDQLEGRLDTTGLLDADQQGQLARFFAGYRLWAGLDVWASV